ncbi:MULTISPECIES: alpha/beta hydrolase [unclassified Roseitalea]|uniref:alpha/beta fold hydrolase n=1 Tax=unclassified Roseitalea TaxID=2639107 RepID=UPI00273D8948|nr:MULTISPECIES: alpha/beta hydrolase [unclassified Roseitalea]
MTEADAANRDGAPALVFLHGWTMDGSAFADITERLRDRFTCLAPDLPGHGTAVDLRPDIESAADHVHALLESRDIGRAVLIGWSMGAAVAWRLIALHGTGLLAGLVTVDMSPKLVNEGGWTLGLTGQTPRTIAANIARFERDWAGSAGAIAAGMFATRKGPAGFGFRQAAARIAANDPVAMNAMWACLVAMDERKTVPKVDVPWLVMCGERSRVYPEAAADWLVAHAPDARKLRFAHSGHSPHLEEPDAFAGAIARFADRVGARRTVA